MATLTLETTPSDLLSVPGTKKLYIQAAVIMIMVAAIMIMVPICIGKQILNHWTTKEVSKRQKFCIYLLRKKYKNVLFLSTNIMKQVQYKPTFLGGKLNSSET